MLKKSKVIFIVDDSAVMQKISKRSVVGAEKNALTEPKPNSRMLF